jgi:sigma-B regulation protein RsbU (phosphoserine phosphatase)
LQNIFSAKRGAIGFWSAVPASSRLVGAAVVFFLFATMGFVTQQMDIVEHGPRDVFLTVAISGTFAVGYAASAVTRRYWGFAALIVLQFFIEYWLHRVQGPPRSLAQQPAALQHQLILLGIGGMVSIVVGYLLLILFVRRLGESYFRVQTEVKLAGEIHAALVPVIQKRIGQFEFYGISQPSGEVGGDLVDVTETQDNWTGYIADVSGHGVSSGVLMAMFKTAMRTRLLEGDSPAQALNGVHKALFPLKPSNMFVTVAVLQSNRVNQIHFASAGHPPVLHYHRNSRSVTEYPPNDAPLGLFDGQNFSESAIESSPGDILLILTDGLSEVFDRHGKELGLEPIKSAFAGHAELPLPDMVARLRAVARDFGAQNDDQTILLARRVA